MSIVYNTSIVMTGLVLHLDAANTKSYPGVGNTFYDISGNGNHHTLVGSPTVSGKAFGLNETQGFQRSSAIPNVTANCTVVIWYATTDTQELWVRGNGSGSVYLSASYGNNYYHSNCGSPTNYVDLAVVTNPATPTNYRNGAYHMWEAKNVDFTTWTVYDWFLYGSSWNITGNIGSIMVYNRTLSAAESAQNFAAYRGRYGI